MLIIKKKTKKRYLNKVEGNGIFDSLLSPLISAVTSNAVKEVGINLSKTATTKLGEKAIEKVSEKIFNHGQSPANSNTPKKESEKTNVFTPQSRMLLDDIVSRGRGIRRI